MPTIEVQVREVQRCLVQTFEGGRKWVTATIGPPDHRRVRTEFARVSNVTR